MPATPATRPSTATNTGLSPSATHRLGGAARVVGHRRPRGLDVRPVPDADVAAVEPAGDALARDLDHVLDRAHDRERRPGRVAEGARHGVRRLRLEGPRELERRVVAVPAGDRRPALGERAGLVEQHGVDRAQPLERVGVLDEDAGARRPQQRHRHRERHRQAERARAGHDEQRDDALERDRRAAVAATRRRSRPPARAGPARSAAPARSVVRSSAGLRESASCTIASSAPTRVCVARGVDADDEARPEVRRAGVHRVAFAHGQRARPRRSARRCRATSGPTSTTPSTGTSSPERTSTRSPGASAVSGTSTTGASGPAPVELPGELEERDAAQAVGALEGGALRAPLDLPRAEQRRDEHRQRVEPERPAAAHRVPRARGEGDGTGRSPPGRSMCTIAGAKAGDRRPEERPRREQHHRHRDDEREPAEEGLVRRGHARSTRPA